MATWLAMAAVSRELADGFVVGIEGAWGSGKSSLVHLARHQWEMMEGDKKPVIVDFNPWLVGERDALLVSLFDDLRRKIDGIKLEAGDATGTSFTAVKDAIKTADQITAKLKSFGRRLTPLRYVAEGVSYFDLIPGATLAAKTLKKIEEASQQPDIELEESTESLIDLKADLDDALGTLNRRIIVIIDDLDRLEPKEIMEILRLVRSVADFKNVTYVLCYDGAIVTEAINSAMAIQDGGRFLEKIVQLEINIPRPESFALRRMFQSQLADLIPDLDEEAQDRMRHVIDRWGGRYLTTPRLVHKVMDSIRFAWPNLAAKVDAADYVFLQLLKAGNRQYYDWVESYVTTVVSMELDDCHVEESSKFRLQEEFVKIFEEEKNGGKLTSELLNLEFILPLVSSSIYGNEKLYFYRGGSVGGIAARYKRLASAHHSRLYFAGYQPTSVPEEEHIEALINAAAISAEAIEKFFETLVDQGDASKLPSMIDLLCDGWEDKLTPEHARNLVTAFAEIMDLPEIVSSGGYDWKRPNIWHGAERLMLGLRSRINSDPFSFALLVKDGAALGWLNHLVRGESFRHSALDPRLEKPEDRWLMTDDQINEAKILLLDRIENMSAEALLATPSPNEIIYNWHDLGDSSKVRNFIHALGNENFVSLMEAMANIISSDAGPIITKEIQGYIDYDKARDRITSLATDDGPLNKRAKTILKQFENGDKRD